MSSIQFKINYEVQQKRKFERFLEQYQTAIGYELQALTIERYWKIKEQFQATFFISVYTNETQLVEKEKLVYELLLLANKLSSGNYANWTFNGPHETPTLVFECILNNDSDHQPLKWANLVLEIG